MLRVDSVEGLLGVRAPFACLFSCWWFVLVAPQFWLSIAIFGYTRMHNFAPARSRRCEFAHLCSGGVCLLYEVRAWLHF